MQKQKQEIIVIRKEAKPILAKGDNLKIKDEKSMTLGVELLSQANSLFKSIKAEHDSKTTPYDEKIKEIDADFIPSEKALKNLISYLRTEIGEYQTRQTDIASKKQEKISEKVNDGKIKFETGVKKMNEVDVPAGKISTDSGKVSFRTDKKLKIINFTEIPREYLIPDEKRILEALKAGKIVPGCTIEIIQTPINRSV